MKTELFFSGLLMILSVPISAQVGDLTLEQKKGATSRRVHERVPADPQLSGSGLLNLLIGENYRREWRDTVRVPVLKFKSDFGGLTPQKEGGGKQTRTLYLRDAHDREWVLRSVRKYPEKAVPAELRGTLAERVVQDGLSASYPYSALSVGVLARAAGVPYFPNTLVYVADDPALGAFRSTYKNTLALLELRTLPATGKAEPWDTEKLLSKLLSSPEHLVDERAVLRGRLLDNFIMDFDRHEGQWLWAERDSAGRTFYYPIAKDRDQAFFRAEGLLPRLLKGQPPLGFLQGLSAQAKDIATFNYAARDFDRTFLSELDEGAWIAEIDRFLAALTDKVIEEALDRQPEGIRSYKAASIAALLKKKRAYFKEDLLAYYRFLSQTVSVRGTNEAERFTLTKNADGSLLVQVEPLHREGRLAATTYRRLFDPAVTREVCVYALEGDDSLVVWGGQSPITIRLVGGPGEDHFVGEGSGGRVLAYDATFEANSISGNPGIKSKFSSDPLTNEYRRLGTQYPSSSLGLMVEYAPDGELLLGPRYRVTRPGFRKDPYGSRQSLSALRSVSSPAYRLRYEGDFTRVWRNTDLLLRADAQLPTTRTHFFGLGNDSYLDPDKKRGYYQARYHLSDLSVLARHRLKPWLQLRYGPVVQYIKLPEGQNGDRYIGTLIPVGGKGAHLYEGLWYAGSEIRMEANTKNNQLLPTRGVQALGYVRGMEGLGKMAGGVGQVGSVLSVYTDRLWRDHLIIASSLGAGHTLGTFEFHLAQYLGYKQNLRGYRFQRFAGRTRAYNNTELRVNFGEGNFYLFKGPFGVLGFHDIGRVWSDGETSRTWHRGYGGGVWVAPFQKLVVNATLMYSKEEKAFPLLSAGFHF